ncbi:phage capsid protein [Novosphingobium huizhouense]|uniref:phage capsid protein n=1 Tax=Novosphingobium huizhouense TaxID=2866625 RepID=UPI001CD8C8D0|nr:phage capsid protein [Novosphingobium huizhouense]
MAENFADNHRNITFSNNVTATLRQEPGMLYGLCGSSAPYTGSKKARIENRFGRLKMEEKQGRNTDTNSTDIDSVARWIAPGKKANVAPLLDRDDSETTEVDLGSPLVKEVAAAAATYHDDMFGVGYFGNAWSGELGDTAVPFKNANIIAHGGTGLTLDKLIATRELLRKRHVNIQREKPIILLQPEDETDLLQIPEYKSFDYNGSKPLENGEIKPFMGFRFFSITPDAESMPRSYASFFANGGATRQLPVFVPSGLHRGVWVEFWGKITDRADKNHSEQFYGEARSAVVRTDEDKCFILQTQ